MELPVRFSSLVRSGLRFRRTFELAKQNTVGEDDWYPYDCFTNLFPIEQLRRAAGLSLADLTGNQPVLDLGTADGALAFLFESLGHRVPCLRSRRYQHESIARRPPARRDAAIGNRNRGS